MLRLLLIVSAIVAAVPTAATAIGARRQVERVVVRDRAGDPEDGN